MDFELRIPRLNYDKLDPALIGQNRNKEPVRSAASLVLHFPV